MDPEHSVKPNSRHTTIRVLDWLIVAAALVTLIVRFTDGFYAEPWGLRVSMRRFERPLLVAAALIVFRRWLDRDTGFLGIPGSRYKAWWLATFRLDADSLAGVALPSRVHTAAGAIALVVAGLGMYWVQLAHMESVPDLGDPLFSMWRMGWIAHQLSGDPRPFFDANIFNPTPLTLTFSDSMLLPSLLAAPFLDAGLRPSIVYNAFFLAGILASGLATYFLVKRLTRSIPAAFIGGLLYTLHPYRFEHYAHFELQMTMWMPLGLLALLRFCDSLRLRDAMLAALCMAAQLYSSMYYGIFFPLFAGAIVITLLVLTRAPWGRVLRPAAVAGLVAVVLAAPLAGPYVRAQAIKGERDEGVVKFYSADIEDFFRPHQRLATYTGHLLPDVHPERALFPGFSPLVLSLVSLAPPIGQMRLAFTAGLLVAGDMTQGLNGSLYPFLYDVFPPIRGMRVPARFSILLGIALAVLASFGVRRLLARCRTPASRALVLAGMTALVLVDLRPKLELMPVWREPPPIYDVLKVQADPVVLAEFPFELTLPLVTNEIPFMYFSMWHWLPMVNGYSGFFPPGRDSLPEIVRGFPDAASIAALRMHGATHVTINCALMGPDCDAVMRRADQTPQLTRLKEATWEGKAVRLYKLR